MKIFNFKNELHSELKVTEETIETGLKQKILGHHIVVIDRSGSMYRDINALKETVTRILTIDEYRGSEMLISVISYSSKGDVTCHINRVPLHKIMAMDSVYLEEIKKIHVTGLTCMSQALEMAKGLINSNEITGITLHSDGFANDPSSNSEYTQLRNICTQMRNLPVFLNTIAYNEYSDFTMLSEMANTVSGTCTHAKDTKQVYDAIYASCELVNNAGPTLEFENNGKEKIIYVSKNPSRIIGSDSNLIIRSVSDGKVYRFENGETNETATKVHYYILCRYYLATGKLNEAKFALFSSGNKTLFDKHYKALTPNQIGEFATDIEKCMMDDSSCEFVTLDKMIPNMPTILEVLNVIDKHKHNVKLDIKSFLKDYKSVSVKRLVGTRTEDGTLVEPEFDIEEVNKTDFANINSFQFSRASATINMNTAYTVNLVNRKTRKIINEVAGITLDNLKNYHSYTLISNGDVHSKNLPLKIEKKSAFDDLKSINAVTGTFTPGSVYNISLDRPVCNLNISVGKIKEAIENAFAAKIINGFLTAISKEVSAEYTPEQIEALKKHGLSKSLNINFPTVNSYSSLEEAIKNGEIDKRTVYNIMFGTVDILSTDSFYSANEIFQRYYAIGENKKPKLSVILENKNLTEKTLSARSKETAADLYQKELLDSFIGQARVTKTLFEKVCNRAGCTDLIKSVIHMEGEELLRAIEDAKIKMNAFENEIWNTVLCPIVFYIGSSGLIPDELNGCMMDADLLMKKYPKLSLSKTEKTGTFFVIDNMILSVYSKEVYSSINK